MAKIVGIVDYHGQVHCMEHASTVSSYESEVHSTDPVRECWCGERLGGRKKPQPGPTAGYIRMTDGIKGKRGAGSGSALSRRALNARGR